MKKSNTMKSPKSIVVDGKKITRNQFVGAMLQFGDDEGYSYDGFSTGMTWLGVVNNKTRGDGKTEREVWLPLLMPYLD